MAILLNRDANMRQGDNREIYFGDQYADPTLPTVQKATIINGQMVVPPSGPTIVNINGTDYVTLSYELENGQTQAINIRYDLFEDIRSGSPFDASVAAGLIGAALLDLSSGLLPGMRDMDNDGDIDLHDAEAVFSDMFLNQANQSLARGDDVDALAYMVLANSVPDTMGLLADMADITTGDENEPSGGGDGGAGGSGGVGDGDSGWLF